MAKRPQLTGRAAILALVVCAIAMSLAYPVREYIAQRRNIAELEQQRARVEAERQKLAEQARQVNDPDWTKRTAKERLHYCGPGEKCYVVMKADPNDEKKPVAAAREQPSSPWYQKVWESIEAADTGTGQKAPTGEKSG
ncbi:septum formation initiator family protein [Nonomuraea sp. NBC_01738]|uniref:FtsB family cell division protein n=1 Tax=Nonomuraea sp. NBC_01738 TaxID=2976003 RepID=UPI002E11FA9A|nr:septum formation initiator family protein [Nonomuraea sp. NBC_01738]